MGLSQDQKNRLVARLRELGAAGPPQCTFCAHREWEITDALFGLPEWLSGGIALDRKIMPIVTLTCGNCGHVLLFNAVRLGVLGTEPENLPSRKDG